MPIFYNILVQEKQKCVGEKKDTRCGEPFSSSLFTYVDILKLFFKIINLKLREFQLVDGRISPLVFLVPCTRVPKYNSQTIHSIKVNNLKLYKFF
jgi:hypothetical protein